MADVQKTTYELNMGFLTKKGKTKYITIPRPRRDLKEAETRAAMQYILDNGILLDSDNESYTSIVTAYTEEKIKTSLDLTY